jgi:hypothetical protein
VTAAPLAVELELNEPQVLAELPGVQLQFTPPFAGSPVTVAAMFGVALGARVAGGGVVSVTLIPEAGVMVIAGVLWPFVGSVTEVAVITTVLAGTVRGAV